MPEALRLVFVDNFDSFTWNLVDEFARRGCEVEVWRNTVLADAILTRALQRSRSLLVLSPGPGAPGEAGCCMELVRLAAEQRMELHPLQQLVDVETRVVVVEPDHETERHLRRAERVHEAAAERIGRERPAQRVDDGAKRLLHLPQLLHAEREELWVG